MDYEDNVVSDDEFRKQLMSLSAAELYEYDGSEGIYLNKNAVAILESVGLERYTSWVDREIGSQLIDSMNDSNKVSKNMADYISNLVYDSNLVYILQYVRLKSYYHNIKIPIMLPSINEITHFCIQKEGQKKMYVYGYLYNIVGFPTHDENYAYSKWICVSPSVTSDNSEYRENIFPRVFVDSLGIAYGSLLFDVEEFLIQRTKYKIHITGCSDETALLIKRTRYEIKMLIMAWVILMCRKKIHMLDTYDKTADDNMVDKEDDYVFSTLIEKYGVLHIKRLYFWLNNRSTYKKNSNANTATLRHSMSQKITYTDDSTKFNIKNKHWREIYIMDKLSRLLANNICVNIAINLSYVFAENIVVNPNEPEIQKNIILSAVENAGYHLSYRMKIYEKTKKEHTNPLNKESDVESYIFSIIYAFACMIGKCGIIHCDASLNNVMLYKIQMMEMLEGMHMTYVLNNKVYAFEHTKFHPFIIDFSKSLILSKDDDLCIHLIPEYKNTILSYYDNLFPSELEKIGRDKLVEAMDKNFEVVYNLFSVIDPYMFADNMKKFIKEHEHKTFTPAIIEKLDKIQHLAKQFLCSDMAEAVRDIIEDKEHELRCPAIDIIEAVFEPIKNKKSAVKKISGLNIFDNSTKAYSIFNVDGLPTYIKKKGYLVNGKSFEWEPNILFTKNVKTSMYLNSKVWTYRD